MFPFESEASLLPYHNTGSLTETSMLEETESLTVQPATSPNKSTLPALTHSENRF